MNKLIYLAPILIIIFVSSYSTISAKTATHNNLQKELRPYPTSPLPGYYYHVIFDGKGEANVLASMTRLNTGNSNINEIVLDIPGKFVELEYAFQNVSQNYLDNRFVFLTCRTDHLSKSDSDISMAVYWAGEANSWASEMSIPTQS